MSVRKVKAGTTDVSINLRIVDSTDGTPETGVVFNTAGIDLWYRREGALSVDITEATLAALTTAHSDGGFLHINDGWYRLDLPDAACATGVTGVQIGGTVTGMVVLAPYIELVAYDPYDTVRLGLTALPNAAADAAGGLPISDAGGLNLDGEFAKLGTPSDFGSGTSTIAANLQDLADNGTATFDRSTDSLQALRDHIGDGTNLTEAGGTGDHLTAINLPNQTMDIVGNITGNLSGSVGSVTGNVGGNVAGSVGSLGATAKTDVNAEVVDALATDTYAEPGQGAPGATVSLATKINYLYKAWRNKKDNNGTTTNLYDDAGTTVDQKQTTSEAAGTVTKAEWVTGP